MEYALYAMLYLFLLFAFFGAGWYLRGEKYKTDNARRAAQMMASVAASRSRRKPEDMLDYKRRQRTAGNYDNPIRAKQSKVRFVGRQRRHH